jgi:hypothetical protein
MTNLFQKLSPLCLLFLSTFIFGQQQPAHEKKIYIDSLGRYYQQATMPVYLFIASTSDGKPTAMKPVSKKEIVLEGHGMHSFKHENIVTKETDEYHIFADGLAPVTTPSFTRAPEHLANGKQFYGSGLVVALKSKDEMSGLEEIYHSTNAEAFQKYSPPSFATEGEFVYAYYALDRTGNAEKVKSKIFTIDLSAPTSFHNFVSISSENVISTNSTVYLTVSDNLSGIAKTFYKFDKETFKPYVGGNIPFQYLPDGDHTLTYYSVDNVTNKETEKSFTFYLDKTAPIMSADVLGDKFLVGERVYFSGRTKLKLTAVDNKSGVKNMMYSINNEPELKYTEPFYLPGRSGLHNVKFRAVDNTNNPIKDDFEHTVGVIYVDLTGPAISHTFNGPTFNKADTLFISPKTRVTLAGNDPEAGLKKITYRLDGAPAATDETTYSKPIELATDGMHKLIYFGYDNVNNKNTRETFFIADTHGPEITSQFASPANKEGKYPSYTTLYLAAVDAEVGADQIQYSINDAKPQPYLSPIKGFMKNKEYTLKITATDMLGNSSATEVKFKTDTY